MEMNPPANMSQLQPVEEDSLANGDEPPCKHVPATTCWGRLIGQWRWTPLQTCPSYNLLRKTTGQWRHPANMSQLQPVEEDHWPVETPCRHVPATTCWGRPQASGDTLQTCPSYNLLKKTHWPVETPCRHVPATTFWGRITGHWRQTPLQTCPSNNLLKKTHWPVETDPPPNMSQLQPVEEDSLAIGDRPPTNMSQLQPVRKTHWPVETDPPANMSQLQPVEEDHWPVETPCRHVPATICWRRLTGKWRHPADMSQIQPVEEDHWPVETPCRHVPATTCWGRLIGHWRQTPLQTCPSYNLLGRLTGQWRRTPLQTCPSYNLLGRLTGQWRRTPYKHVPATTCWEDSLASGDGPPTNMSQLQPVGKTHWPVETDPLQTCPSYNLLGRLTGPWRRTPYKHVPATTC